MVKYIPKFKTGQSISSERDFDGIAIIIDSYIGMRKYIRTTWASDYDERDTDHTLYLTYTDGGRTYWVWEPQAVLECSNTKRGKQILRDNGRLIAQSRGISVEGFHLLMESFKESEQDTN